MEGVNNLKELAGSWEREEGVVVMMVAKMKMECQYLGFFWLELK